MSTPLSPGEFLFVYTVAVTAAVFVVGAVWWNRRQVAAAKARAEAQAARVRALFAEWAAIEQVVQEFHDVLLWDEELEGSDQ